MIVNRDYIYFFLFRSSFVAFCCCLWTINQPCTAALEEALESFEETLGETLGRESAECGSEVFLVPGCDYIDVGSVPRGTAR